MIVVTGAAGFIGSAFVRRLNAEGITDLLLVDEFKSTERWRNLVGKSFRDFLHKDDFLAWVEAEALPDGIEAIVHMGACSSTLERDSDYLLRNNYEYTKSLARYSLEKGIRFIYASSGATYGDGSAGYADDESKLQSLSPLNAYGFSKHLFDLWAKQEGVLDRMAGLKFFNVYGPNEYYKDVMASVVYKAFEKIQRTGSFQLFKSHRPDFKDGEQKRDFVYVKDCCDVMLWLLQNPKANGLLNVGAGSARTWNDLVTSVFVSMGKQPNITYIDMPEEMRAQYQYFTEAPTEKLRALGYKKPMTSIEDGVRDYVSNHLLVKDRHF